MFISIGVEQGDDEPVDPLDLESCARSMKGKANKLIELAPADVSSMCVLCHGMGPLVGRVSCAPLWGIGSQGHHLR